MKSNSMNEVDKSLSSHKRKKKTPFLDCWMLGRSFQWLGLNHREINLVQIEISIALFWLYLGAEKLLKIDQDSLPNILFILILCSCKICKNCNNFLLKILLKCWDYLTELLKHLLHSQFCQDHSHKSIFYARKCLGWWMTDELVIRYGSNRI